MKSINVPLPPAIIIRLRQLAERELRDPQQQAAVLIMDGLEQAGIFDRSPAHRSTDQQPEAAVR